MKQKLLVSAVSCALAAFGGAATATPIDGSIAYSSANTAFVYSSGSSALDPAIARLSSRACQPGTLDTYGYSNLTLYLCKPTTATGVSKTYLAYQKYSANGSYNGVVGVAEQSTFAYIDLSQLTAATGGTNLCPASAVATVASVAGVSTSDSIGIPAYTVHSCASTTPALNTAPQFGFADVEPKIFGSASDLSKLTSIDLATQVFAVPLTVAARNALITSQIAQGTLPASCSPTAAANSVASTSVLDQLQCMPSLPKEVLTAVYNGSNIISWSQLGVTLTDDNIYIARRSDVSQPGGHVQSGSQATFEALVTQELCSNGLNGFALYTDTNDKTNQSAPGINFVSAADCDGSGPAGVPFVWGGSGTGDVQLCLDQHQASGRGAIGVLGSLDVPISASAKLQTIHGSGTSVAGDFGYRFIKVDGAAPTIDQVANGAYPIWVESTISILNTIGTGTDQYKMYAQLGGDFSSQTVLQDVNKAGAAKLSLNTTGGTTTTAGFGTPGLASLPAASNPYGHFPITATDVVTTPVNLYTRQISAGAPNSCQPGQFASPAL